MVTASLRIVEKHDATGREKGFYLQQAPSPLPSVYEDHVEFCS